MRIEVGGIELNYEQAGTGPDCLLLPGLGASVHVWYSQIRALSPYLRLTAMDLRGHGRSATPPGPYTIRQIADDAANLMQSLGTHPSVVVGSSMSSLVAVELAAAYPELVSALVLVGGFAGLSPEGRERFRQRAVTVETEGMAALADAVVGAAMGAATHQTQPGLVGLYRQALLGNDPRGYAACCRAIAEADTRPLFGSVRCPVLVLYGEQEQVAPLPAARVLKQGLPQAQVRVIPAAGHLPFLEQPAAFNAALQEFLAGLPGGPGA